MEYLISIALGGIASQLQGKLKNLKSGWRFFIAMSSCVLVASIVTAFNVFSGGTFNMNELLASFSLAFATSQTYYNMFFKDLK